MNKIKVLITGAAGQIGCNFIPLVTNGNVFGPNQKVVLKLLEVTPCMNRLKGVAMEIEDGAYDLVDDVVITDDPKKACEDIDYAVLIGGFSVKGSWKNFERNSLLTGNVPIFSQIGKALDKYAKKSVKVLVVANPANTNALIAMRNAPSIPKENFTALSRLDYNRGVSNLAKRLNVPNNAIKNFAIWGNHSRTLIGDASKATVTGKCLTKELNDDDYLQNDFNQFLRDRFYKIVEMRGVTSSLSAANAAKDHIKSWHFGTEPDNNVSMCVLSDKNPYGVKEGLIFSFPVHIENGKWRFSKGYEHDERMKKLLKETEEELEGERKIAENLLEKEKNE